MTFFSNKENQTSTELLPVSTERLFVSSVAPVSTASSGNARPVTPCSQFAVQNDATKSEILRALHICYKRLSYHSYSELGLLFQDMFPDSLIAKPLTIGKTKMAYNITYGLSPYFHSQVEQLVSSAKYIAVCFAESLREVIQKEQMNICVRLWDLNRNKVAARYFSSAILGHTTAKNLYDGFTTVLNNDILPKMLLVSVDGPSVNWKFFDALFDDFEEKFEGTLLEMASCGLHVVHGAFKNGHKNPVWNINSVLRSF